jgi:hypothetical protein
MLIGILQSDKRLDASIQKYGCLFLCLAHASPVEYTGEHGVDKLNKIWQHCHKKGYISTADIMLSHAKVAEALGLKVRYFDKHYEPTASIPENVDLVIGQFLWLHTHFVLLNKQKQVIFDPIGKSNTVAKGKLVSLRYYQKL